jgi:hypothetical protein
MPSLVVTVTAAQLFSVIGVFALAVGVQLLYLWRHPEHYWPPEAVALTASVTALFIWTLAVIVAGD